MARMIAPHLGIRLHPNCADLTVLRKAGRAGRTKTLLLCSDWAPVQPSRAYLMLTDLRR